ncbi:MAG: hypothetical protein Q9218_004205 [Villophora microphyllina]
MNDETSSSTSSQPQQSNQSSEHALYPSSAEAAADAEEHSSEQQTRGIRMKYKTRFLDNIIRQLDMMIYCQLSVLYYMDCSFLSFFARSVNHWFYFTPKPPLMNAALSLSGPQIIMIFGINLLSLFLHTIYSPPTAGEATREYLHGGLLIDFVGQKSPVSRVRLVACDLVVLALQLVILSVTCKRRRLNDGNNAAADGSLVREAETQDHDFEERGIRRSEDADEIELQFLRPLSGGRTGGEEDGERDELMGTSQSAVNEHPGDVFYSGQYIVADINIFDTIKGQWRQSYVAATRSSGSGSMGAAAAAELARRRLRFRFRIGRREFGS